jgi:hypothetical protein
MMSLSIMSAGCADEDLGSIRRAHNGHERVRIETTLQKITYNTRDSLVVTDPTTDLAVKSLCFRKRGVKKQG